MSTADIGADLAEEVPPNRLFIGGDWAVAGDAPAIDIVSPLTEQVLATVPAAGRATVDRAVMAAREAFDHGPWPRLPIEERAAVISRLAASYASRREQVAQLITAEMGCPITLSRVMQATTPQVLLESSVAVAHEFPFEEEHRSPTGSALLLHEPVGVVAAIVPWNSPHTSALAKLGPALLAGCTAVLKPAPETALDALLLARMFEEAGLPRGVLSVLPADREVSAYLAGHPGVDKVAFTGSTAAGQAIAARCGADVRRVTLELGGKSAAIVLDDADLGQAVESLRMVALRNTGQVCTNTTRVLVSRNRRPELVERLVAMMTQLAVGNPFDEKTEVGPLVSARQRDRVESYIAAGRAVGARLGCGGKRPAEHDRGWFVEPTLFYEVDNGMTIAREEIFGPVLSVIDYTDEDEAVDIANDSSYGLSGAVYSSDPHRALDVARRIRTGAVLINGNPPGFQAPFGGVKMSGLGRENGPQGLAAYLETKSVGLPPDMLGELSVAG